MATGVVRKPAEGDGESLPIEIDLTDIAFGGDALGRLDGEIVFVPYGLPGERVLARPGFRKRDYMRAEVIEVVRPAPARVTPRCRYFGNCGGCQWQHAAYSFQLAMKRRMIVDQLRRIGGFEDAEELVREPVGMIEPWEYRNHVRFTLGRKYGDLGYTYRDSHRLLPVDYCDIAHPAINEVLRTIQRRCAGLKAHQIIVRCSSNTGDLLVSPRLPMIPELESGQPELADEILDRRFHISGAAFFQVNTRREQRGKVPLPFGWPGLGSQAQAGGPASEGSPPAATGEKRVPSEGWYSIADLLALTVLERLEAGPDDVVVDAYSGVGTFSALLGPRVKRVVGIEESKAAVKDAVRNTEDLDNVRFIAAKTENVLGDLDESRIDSVLLDPSRPGCAPAVIGALIERRPRRVLYVSCDAATLARDLRLLREGGYRIDAVEPLDMFPQTYHVECVATLTFTHG